MSKTKSVLSAVVKMNFICNLFFCLSHIDIEAYYCIYLYMYPISCSEKICFHHPFQCEYIR